jgi:competence protein ComEC
VIGITDLARQTTPVSPGDETSAAHVWHAPLVPVALAATAGIVLDRYLSLPLPVSLLTAFLGLVAWTTVRLERPRGLPLVYLGLTVCALGAAYHHWQREIHAADDIGKFVRAAPQPVQVRGVLAEEPSIVRRPQHDDLQSFGHPDSTVSVLRVHTVKGDEDWIPASGRARLTVAGRLESVHAGDEVEVVGRLVAPQGPANPGEFDFASHLRDQGIWAWVVVQKTSGGVTRLAEGWRWSFTGSLAVLRGWGRRTLEAALPPHLSGVAAALLLGDDSAMMRREWDKYIRTGVIHVLAVSGQHLSVLAIFLWWTLRIAGIGRRQGALFVGLFLLGYALLAGGRPPVLRAGVAVTVGCLGLLLRRPTMLANTFALAWLIVAALDPTDLFGTGCLLSFLSVAVLYWGCSRLFRRDLLPLDRLVEQTRPRWQRALRWLGRQAFLGYATGLAIWLALTPLVAARTQLVSFVGLLIGPPLVILTSAALIAGFLLLLTAAVCGPLVPVFAWPTRWALEGCEWLVGLGERLPASHWYVGTVPEWWLWVFYVGLFAVLLFVSIQRLWRWAAAAGLGWLCVGLLGGAIRLPAEELRCTFLAVGHGGCTVLETPDGRTLLYDTGSLSGPDVTERQIAPYLWHRGIRRIDEVFLSHADLDHFNGLPALLERFAVGQVTCTPTFRDKASPGVAHTLAALDKRRIPIRIVSAGDRLSAGPLEMQVLHPPRSGPEGNENARSMVLLVRHLDHSILLTGDLEGPGLERLLSQPRIPVDVLMAPHHGSRTSNISELASWAQARAVISCEGPPRSGNRPPEPYTPLGATFLGTWPHGAVTVHSHPTGLVIDTYQSGQRLVIRRGAAPEARRNKG